MRRPLASRSSSTTAKTADVVSNRSTGSTCACAPWSPRYATRLIANGNVQIVDAYSTDAEISQYNLDARDDRHLFPASRGAPMMREDFAKDHPKVVAALNKLAGRITDEEMSRMNYEVKVNGRSAAAVARDYLQLCHLLG